MLITFVGGSMKLRVELLLMLTLFNAIKSIDLIWDFGGILFEPYYMGVAGKVGIQNFLLYMIMDQKSPDVQDHLFKFLDTVMPDDKKFGPVGTGDGFTLPPIMRHWQAGTILAPEVIKMTTDHIKKMDRLGYFESQYEKLLLQRIVKTMFDPKILADNIYPVNIGVHLLKRCAAARNPDGSRKNRNIGCSNMDPLTFKLSKEKYPEIFELFDGGIVISGDIGMVKPDKEFYQFVITKFNLDLKSCFLIDDQDVNTKGARACNINTLLLRNRDYKRLEQELISYGAINPK